METTMYTFTANEIVVAGSAVRQASGGDRRMVYLRHPVQENTPAVTGKVIDFNAWRAAQEEQAAPSSFEESCDFEDETEFSFLPEEYTCTAGQPARRPRSSHARKGMYLDWMASAALIAVAISACIGFLL